MTDIYQPPTANLSQNTVPFDGHGSIENGIAGNYSFSIGAIISEAWSRTSGSKGTIWLAVLFYMLVLIPVSMAMEFVLKQLGLVHVAGDVKSIVVFSVASELVKIWIVLPLVAGLWMVCVKLAVRAPVEASEIFNYYPKVLSLVGTTVLMYLMIAVGFCLFILPGLYLMVAYWLALPLVVEKNLSPWQALETSRKAISHKWFSMFGLSITLVIIMILGMIPLGIGLIWVVPMMALTGGIVYRNIFGYEGNIAP